MFNTRFGLERETMRVNEQGSFAETPHPFEDSHFERDFCENQLEIITDVFDSAEEAVENLKELSDYAAEKLKRQHEYLWLYSNPPHFSNEDEISVALYKGAMREKYEYRLKLQEKYGRRLMLYSGIHCNLSLSDEYLQELCPGNADYRQFKDSIYLKLLKYSSLYSWVLVLITAASPVYDKSLEGDNLSGTGFDGYASRRNSEKGYWNKFVPKLDYSGISAFVKSVDKYIENGDLLGPSEVYLPIRLKPKGKNTMHGLTDRGVNHIELRMFDVNPFAPAGIFAEDLNFANYLLIYFLSLPDFDFTYELQERSVLNHKNSAGFDLNSILIDDIPAINAADKLFDDMIRYFAEYHEVTENIEWQRKKLKKGMRYSDRVYNEYNTDFQHKFFDKTKKVNEQCASFLVQV
ncbi:MAG: glutathione synthase [Oscillospiraceae bacterium]